MTTEREYQEWKQKIRKVRGQKLVFTSNNKPRKSYHPGIAIMIFLVLIGVLFAVKINMNNQEPVPNYRIDKKMEMV
jgi:hypothetical protein